MSMEKMRCSESGSSQPMWLTSVCVSVSVQFNPLLRDIFGLGAPLILDATVKGNKISRFEKVKIISSLQEFQCNEEFEKEKYCCLFPPTASFQLCCLQGQD